MAQPLLTPTSVALSLSPPRTPPHGSVLRNLYTNPRHNHDHRRRDDKNTNNDQVGDDHDLYQSHTLVSRFLQLIPPRLGLRDLPLHPHLPNSLSFPDKLTRFLGAVLPLETQHSGRDEGYFRSIADGMVTLTCPLVGFGHWKEASEFLELSRSGLPRTTSVRDEGLRPPSNGGSSLDGRGHRQKGRRRRRWTRKRIPYGDHSMQFFDLFLPAKKDRLHSNNDNKATNVHSQSSFSHNKTSVRGTLFFVHGGAWGSGRPWMYRLVAPAFLKLNFAVAIAGYRTYPDAPTIDDQCRDVRLAWDKCGHVLNELAAPVRDGNDGDGGGWVGNVICGHSSGAHVAMLILVDMIGEWMKNEANVGASERGDRQYPWDPHFFVGLSGPYDISYHFDYEAGRGVEQISPMGAICGRSRENFDRASPVKRLLSLFGNQKEEMASNPTIQRLAPPMLLVHGIEDSTVPFTATSDARRSLRGCGLEQCKEVYLEDTGHQDVVMHFMLGGPAKDVVLDWLLSRGGQRKGATQLQSRL